MDARLEPQAAVPAASTAWTRNRGQIVARFARPGLGPREGETAGFHREAILRAALGASAPAGPEACP